MYGRSTVAIRAEDGRRAPPNPWAGSAVPVGRFGGGWGSLGAGVGEIDTAPVPGTRSKSFARARPHRMYMRRGPGYRSGRTSRGQRQEAFFARSA